MSTKDKSLAGKRLSIIELTKYYVKRYGLAPNPCDESNLSESEQFKIKYDRYRAEITRIIKDTPIADKTLWDIIKKKGEWRKISVDEFERFCFTDWSAYVKKLGGGYDEKKMKEDEKRNNIRKEIAKHNELIEEGVEVDPSQPIISMQRLLDTGHKMMLEAIYDVFYGPFNWKQLEKDVELDLLIDGEEEADINDDSLAARQRLQDYKNYCGKKKSWEDAENL